MTFTPFTHAVFPLVILAAEAVADVWLARVFAVTPDCQISSNLNTHRAITHTISDTYILSESGFTFERFGKLAIFEGRVRLQNLINQQTNVMQITNAKDRPIRQVMVRWESDTSKTGSIRLLPTGEIQFSHAGTDVLGACWAYFNGVYICTG